MPRHFLFVKESQNWPRASGHDVHGYHMMQALAACGNAVSLACVVPPTQQALDGLPLANLHTLATPTAGQMPLTPWQKRFANYYGVKDNWAASLAELLRAQNYDAVVVVARHLLPLLSVVQHAVRVWYPADDPAWHHLSRLKLTDRRTWGELRPAIINALYERAFRQHFDRVWVVSPNDRTATRLITGCRAVDLLPNGVDANFYQKRVESDLPTTCVFWGRLDFGPNVDALEWFLKQIWPTVRAQSPSAIFAVFGFNPTPRVRELGTTPGVELHPDLPDLRDEVTRRSVVVLPFITGGGIKNKLLEAAAMGMPVVCTRRALSGTQGKPAVRVANGPQDWASALAELWVNPAKRRELGAAARRWVLEHHTWDAAARTAADSVAGMCYKRSRLPGHAGG